MKIKKTPLLLVIALLICLVSMPLCAADFDDVKDSDWFASAVDYCYDKGYFYGVSENLFAPNTTMDRAMIVTVLYRCAGEPDVAEEAGFTDVPADEWYTDAVAWGKASGVVAGFDDGTFRPNNAVTREQIMAFFYRYVTEIQKKELPAENDLRIYNSFYDVKSVGSWAVPSVQWCTSVGMICGDAGYIKPADDSTRAEIATILLRLDAFLADDMITITASAEKGGAVVPAGKFTLVNGTAVTFRAEAEKGWSVKGATLNGTSLGAQNMYVVRSAKDPQSLIISFKELVGDPYSGYGQLVNRSNPIPNAASYKPADLKKVKYGSVQLRAEAANALDRMIDAYKKEYPGSTLSARSGYRDHNTQIYLYDRQIGRQGGNKYKAGTISAVPGTSEHELGLAVDLVNEQNSLVQSFAYSKQGKWLAAHCMEYGYILRYPADKERVVGIIYEPWHFRYVGIDIANDMKAKGVTTLEEYYGMYLDPEDIDPYLPYLK